MPRLISYSSCHSSLVTSSPTISASQIPSPFPMKLTYAQLSSTGPVRRNNEDWVGFWEPTDEQEYRTRGVIAALADGVGGHGDGEVASRLAVETALRRFLEIKPSTVPRQALWQM